MCVSTSTAKDDRNYEQMNDLRKKNVQACCEWHKKKVKRFRANSWAWEHRQVEGKNERREWDGIQSKLWWLAAHPSPTFLFLLSSHTHSVPVTSTQIPHARPWASARPFIRTPLFSALLLLPLQLPLPFSMNSCLRGVIWAMIRDGENTGCRITRHHYFSCLYINSIAKLKLTNLGVFR